MQLASGKQLRAHLCSHHLVSCAEGREATFQDHVTGTGELAVTTPLELRHVTSIYEPSMLEAPSHASRDAFPLFHTSGSEREGVVATELSGRACAPLRPQQPHPTALGTTAGARSALLTHAQARKSFPISPPRPDGHSRRQLPRAPQLRRRRAHASCRRAPPLHRDPDRQLWFWLLSATVTVWFVALVVRMGGCGPPAELPVL